MIIDITNINHIRRHLKTYQFRLRLKKFTKARKKINKVHYKVNPHGFPAISTKL